MILGKSQSNSRFRELPLIPGYLRDKGPRTNSLVHAFSLSRADVPTMSDFGATVQFSLHRLARPFTTSALLPISRSNPITFLRHVPILPNSKHTKGAVRSKREDGPSQHVALFRLLQNQHQFVDAVDLIFNALDEGPERVRNVIDKRI